MTKLVSIKLTAATIFLTGLAATTAISSIGAVSLPEVAGSAQSSGATIYADNCARCHGDDGEGDKGPELSSARKQAKYRSNPQSLINKIANGGFKMPKFKKRLTAEQINAVAGFVKTL